MVVVYNCCSCVIFIADGCSLCLCRCHAIFLCIHTRHQVRGPRFPVMRRGKVFSHKLPQMLKSLTHLRHSINMKKLDISSSKLVGVMDAQDSSVLADQKVVLCSCVCVCVCVCVCILFTKPHYGLIRKDDNRLAVLLLVYKKKKTTYFWIVKRSF